jgi:hypothetical protein
MPGAIEVQAAPADDDDDYEEESDDDVVAHVDLPDVPAPKRHQPLQPLPVATTVAATAAAYAL